MQRRQHPCEARRSMVTHGVAHAAAKTSRLSAQPAQTSAAWVMRRCRTSLRPRLHRQRVSVHGGGDGGDAHTCGCVWCGDGASADATVASAHIATVHSSVVARALPRGILEACGNEPVLATRRKPAPAVKAAGASSQERKRRCGESPRRTLDCACPSGGLEVVGFRASGAPFSAGWRAQRVWSMWPRWHGGACVDPARRNGVGG